MVETINMHLFLKEVFMDNKRSIDGLMLVFIGLIIEMFVSVALSFSGGNFVFGTVVNWINVAAFVVGLIGLFELSKVNLNFAKTKIFYIIYLCILIGSTIITSILTGVGPGALLKGSFGPYIAILVISLIRVIALFIIGLMRIKTLMSGCSDVAKDNGNDEFGRSCIRAWSLYLISTIIFTILMVILYIIALATVGSVYSLNLSGAVGATIALAIITVFAVIASIFVIIAIIMVIVKVYGTYSRFKSGNISSFDGKTSDVLNDMKDDHMDLGKDIKDSVTNAKSNIKESFDDISGNNNDSSSDDPNNDPKDDNNA